MPIDDLRAAINQRSLSATEIAAHLAAMKAAGVGYWQDMSEGEWAAALSVWRQTLAKTPAPFAVEAFSYWARTMSRKPAPGDILNRANLQMSEGIKRLQGIPDPKEGAVWVAEKPTDEEIERRRRIVERLSYEFPVLMRMSK